MQIVTAAIKLKDASSLEESYDKLTILKSRHYFVDKGLSSPFPVVMYGCESWTIRKAEH